MSIRTAVEEGSDVSTPGETRSEGRRFAIHYPEYGIVEAFVGYALFYTVVDFATPILVKSLAADFPAYVPGAVQTWAAAALWIILGLTILGQLQVQVSVNPRVFETREELINFLRDERPIGWKYRLNVTLALVGGIVVWALWSAFWNALEELLLAMPEVDAVTVLALETIGSIAVFAMAFAVLSRGIDRLVTGVVRETLYRDAR